MRATRIKMYDGYDSVNNLCEINLIEITGYPLSGWYSKEFLYDYLVANPETIQVNIYPYPNLIPVKSSNDEKYVRSYRNETEKDNLLELPRV